MILDLASFKQSRISGQQSCISSHATSLLTERLARPTFRLESSLASLASLTFNGAPSRYGCTSMPRSSGLGPRQHLLEPTLAREPITNFPLISCIHHHHLSQSTLQSNSSLRLLSCDSYHGLPRHPGLLLLSRSSSRILVRHCC